MFRLYQFPVMYEIIILAHYLHHDLIFKLTDLQAVAAGSLINLATILYIHSIRVSYQITFDIYDILLTQGMLILLILDSGAIYIFSGACHCSIYLLCIFRLSSSHWHHKGQKV